MLGALVHQLGACAGCACEGVRYFGAQRQVNGFGLEGA